MRCSELIEVLRQLFDVMGDHTVLAYSSIDLGIVSKVCVSFSLSLQNVVAVTLDCLYGFVSHAFHISIKWQFG